MARRERVQLSCVCFLPTLQLEGEGTLHPSSNIPARPQPRLLHCHLPSTAGCPGAMLGGWAEMAHFCGCLCLGIRCLWKGRQSEHTSEWVGREREGRGGECEWVGSGGECEWVGRRREWVGKGGEGRGVECEWVGRGGCLWLLTINISHTDSQHNTFTSPSSPLYPLVQSIPLPSLLPPPPLPSLPPSHALLSLSRFACICCQELHLASLALPWPKAWSPRPLLTPSHGLLV